MLEFLSSQSVALVLIERMEDICNSEVRLPHAVKQYEYGLLTVNYCGQVDFTHVILKRNHQIMWTRGG